jgi:hypothetical protein
MPNPYATDTAPDFLPYHQAVRQVERQGYRTDAPASVGDDAVAVDREAWTAGICERCGNKGLLATPFQRDDDNAYLLLVACPACTHTVQG